MQISLSDVAYTTAGLLAVAWDTLGSRPKKYRRGQVLGKWIIADVEGETLHLVGDHGEDLYITKKAAKKLKEKA